MREDTVVEQATARETIHEDVEMLRRFGVPYSRLRDAAVRRDGCRRREGGPRLPRPLIRPEDTLRRAVCAAGTFRSVRRDAIQRDALLARPDVERRSDYQFRVCVENVEICQTDGCRIIFTADGRRSR